MDAEPLLRERPGKTGWDWKPQPVATAKSKPGTKTFAFKIGDDSIYVLGASDVAYGITNAQQIPIVSKTSDTIIANSANDNGVTTIILDTKTLKAIMSNTWRGAGVGAFSFLLQCQ
jgi:hypothetical protein